MLLIELGILELVASSELGTSGLKVLYLLLLGVLGHLCTFFFLALLLYLLHVGLVLLIHQGAQLVDFGLQEGSLRVFTLERQVVFKETTLHKLLLDDLNFPDKVDITSPARHSLVYLFLFVDDLELFLEKLFVSRTRHFLNVPSVVELLVVQKDVCL